MTQIPDKSTIHQAAERIRPYVHRTPVHTSEAINKLVHASVYFKCENFQKAGAFKSRGAVNAVFSLSDEEIRHGVCTHSSGNHAAALARAASLRDANAYIVMPENSSRIKIEATRNYGGIITFCAPTLSSREKTLEEVKDRTDAVEIHPYNNYMTIAGQATAAKELIEDIPGTPDFILAPVGGGGLLSGTALAVKYYSSGTKVIGTEPEGANDAFRSFHLKKWVPSENPKTIADGLLTSLGTLTFPIILNDVQSIVTVSEASIVEAMRLIWTRMKIIAEPSSSVPLAALLEKKFSFQNKKIGIILSGGNTDPDKLPW
ncbi:MAG: pyridoxal-phosphate dependent enzyme [Bacteroidales bacterium]|nr:pyridoxal-phosphate dependent enzyme [Bacteroidales bacterium]